MNLRNASTALAVIAAAVLWTCAGTASATVATNAEDEIYTGTVKAESEGSITLDGTINVSCQKSSFEGMIESHEPEAPAAGELSSLSFSECGNHTVTVVKPGSIELNATSGGDGTLASTGAEITVLTHSLFLGTRHCIYATNKTELGTFTGSYTTNSNAKVDIGESSLPQAETDPLCGENAKLTGSIKVTVPAALAVFKATTTLCKEPPKNEGAGNLKCPPNQSYSGEVIGELTGSGTLNGIEGGILIGTISCNKIEMKGKFLSNGRPNGGVSVFTLTSTKDGKVVPCSSNLPGDPAPQVTISMEKLDYERSWFSYSPKSANSGYLFLTKEPPARPIMSVTVDKTNCKYSIKFPYAAGGLVLNGVDKDPTTIKFEDSTGWDRDMGAAPCPPKINWDFKLNLYRPGKENIYIASE